MDHAAPSYDFYDDGLVHSHDWSRSTPPGQKPGDRGLAPHDAKHATDRKS